MAQGVGFLPAIRLHRALTLVRGRLPPNRQSRAVGSSGKWARLERNPTYEPIVAGLTRA